MAPEETFSDFLLRIETKEKKAMKTFVFPILHPSGPVPHLSLPFELTSTGSQVTGRETKIVTRLSQ